MAPPLRAQQTQKRAPPNHGCWSPAQSPTCSPGTQHTVIGWVGHTHFPQIDASSTQKERGSAEKEGTDGDDLFLQMQAHLGVHAARAINFTDPVITEFN